MDVYGNKTWNDATDNRDKSLVSMNEDTFHKLKYKLDSSGLNFYAYTKDSKTVMAINDKDWKWLKQIAGTDNLPVHKSNVVHIPPEKNIIGNAQYRYIPDKQYLSADRDTALKMAEMMESRNIPFSGRIYLTGKATLTVSNSDLTEVKAIQQSITDMRKQFAGDEKADEIIGNKAYREIHNRHYFHSKMKPEEYKAIQPFLDENIQYSGLIRDGKIVFTVEKEDAQAFYMALESAQRERDSYRELMTSGLSKEHISELSDIIHRIAMEDAPISLDSFFNERYSDEQFSQMKGLTEKYLAQTPTERMLRGSALEEMLNAKNDFDRGIEMTDYFSRHSYSDEQKELITEMFLSNEPRSFIDAVDESFSPDDIRKYNEILHNYENASEITDFLKNRNETVTEESSVHFGLFGNGVTAYDVSRTDPETNDYVTVAHISSEGVVKIYDDAIAPDDMERINAEAQSLREKFVAEKESGDAEYSAKNEQKTIKMTLYHGTTAEFEKFRPDYRGVVWTDTDYDRAKNFAGNSADSKVLTCEAELKNPARYTFGTAENWDIDTTIQEARADGHDSAMIDFKFTAEDNGFYQFCLKNSPDDAAKEILASITDARESDALEGETISEFAKRMEKQNNIVHSYVAVFDPDLIQIQEKTSVAELSPEAKAVADEIENTVRENLESIEETVSEIVDEYVESTEERNDNTTSPTEDIPLFADEDVIEEIQKSERAEDEKPFENTYGEQLSLFGDSVPIDEKAEPKTQRESKSAQPSKLFVGDVNTISALHDEIMRGSGFQGGKFRIQKFYEDNTPDTKAFADFLKQEYGTGGHSADAPLSFVDHDSKGLTFTLSDENGHMSDEKFHFNWTETARMAAELIDKGEYLTEKEQEQYKAMNAPEEPEFHWESIEDNAPEKESATEEAAVPDHSKKSYDVYIYDSDSNLSQPMRCEADDIQQARVLGEEYISKWNLRGGRIDKIEEVQPEAEKEQEKDEIVQENADNSESLSVENQTEVKDTKTDKPDNFTITDDSLGSGGAKTKFRNNVEAIETLKTLEKENRQATDEEKEVLSKYVGWGGIPQAFDKDNSSWEKEYAQLKELLTPQEYRQANASVLDAFYTSPTVIDGIYEALKNFGFKGGNILEPAMGVGNFFGRMPEEMQSDSKLYGVEIDSISGRIAKQLYPDADIAIQGFEKNNFQNGCFDVAVGNVPFGELPFKDDKHHTAKLHDFFFAETLDKIKNGGIVAFVTSAGTLDKRDESTRKALSEKADFIGAIRLPGGKNGAFKDNAGTEVTTDIIFLQKNENKVSEPEKESWLSVGETADGLPINNYFAKNPDMVLGKVVEGNKLYGSGTMVVAEDGADLKAQLSQAVSKLSATISDEKAKDVYAKSVDGIDVKIPSNLRNYSFFVEDNAVFFKKKENECHKVMGSDNKQFRRMKAFIELRDTTRELLEAQELDKPDDVIKGLQAQLNTQYDDFYVKYGLIHSQSNKRYFSDDVSYNLVAGLEKKFDKNQLEEKSDIFTKRTIQPPKAVEHVETAMEALTLSIAEKAGINFEYMTKLTGMREDELKHDLSGEIFKIPHTENDYQTTSEYLSGDIRQKLKIAEEIAEYDSDFNVNVNALKKAMPEPLKAGDIDVKIGATWIDPKYYEQFMYETFGTPHDQRNDVNHGRWYKPKLITAEYSEHSGTWHISNKNMDKSVIAMQQYGSRKMGAYDIMEHLLNLKEPKIYKTVEVPDGMGDTKEKRVIDIDATRVVQKKAEKIKAEFKKWIFKDSQRREDIVEKYNELFNSVRPREYDGSNLTFPMMNSDIKLHDHQKNAIAHAMFGGNTLFAHCVGAGKTFEMIATAMESKRLGLCTKSMFAVPNHLTEQIGDDFQKLYPSANILVATKKDFQKENRQQLFAKIATGNFDAVIIGHSQLGMIPISKERQEAEIQSQIDDILLGIDELKKSEGSKFQIKAMERTKKSLEKQLDKLSKNHDDTITFEQLGVDKLFVDEAHEFKNLFCATKLNNISGISNSASQKALDLYLKCRYLDEKTGGKGVVFATGTPLSNSVTELHTMMRYLEYDFLKDKGLQHFDNWVTVFGEQKTDWELAPAGNKFKERTRIANYSGMPELMSMFKQIADIRTADSLKLDVPDCEYKVVNVEATPFQKELVDELADRADAINAGNVDPSIDNMLKITSDGRKLGLDPRLIDPSFEDNPNTKLNQCVENVARIHAETAEDKLTQIIFCDLGVPHKNTTGAVENADDDKNDDNKSSAERDSLEEECDFCVYEQTLSNGYTITHTYFNSGFSPLASPLSRNL